MNFAPVPAPRDGQRTYEYQLPDGVLSVPLLCHLDHEPEDRSQVAWSERLTLDKAFAGPIDVYNLLDRWTVENILTEALAALKKTRVEID